jgi:hypothetical protein
MRSKLVPVIILAVLCGFLDASLIGRAAAAGAAVPAPLNPGAVSVASKFTEAQLEYVQSWIQRKVPGCPRDAAARAAERFLEELQARYPEKMDTLLATAASASDLESALLRHVGTQLTAAPQSPLREEVARRRLEVILGGAAGSAVAGAKDAPALIGKIKEMSPVYYRRLVEGRMEDDDVVLLIKKAGQPAGAPAASPPVKPKILTVAEIVSEFARHNQEGSAMQHLRAYTIEGRLRSADGEEQQIWLYKMRPNRFRLVVQVRGSTRFILGFDGEHYWEQVPGQPARELRRDAAGARRYLSEFADPLFGESGATFERLEDGLEDGRKFLRVAVRRMDGSRYVAQLDPLTYGQIGRENEDKSSARYSDFREIGGITNPFREEITDQAGRKGAFELSRYTPNPGLVQAFFEAAPSGKPDYFDLERVYAKAAVSVAK